MNGLQNARERIISKARSVDRGGVQAEWLAAACEALLIVQELDEDETKDRPPTNVIVAELLGVLR